MLPILTPLAVDPAHPFPFLSNLSLSLAVAVRAPSDAAPRFARVKVPRSLPRWIKTAAQGLRYLSLEELIAQHLDRLFPGMEVLGAYPFRVTRNADVRRAEETAEDLLEVIQEELRERRFATMVRLEIEPGMPGWMRELLHQHLQHDPRDLFELRGPLGLTALAQIAGLQVPGLRDRPWTPVTHPRLQAPAGSPEPDVFEVIAQGDVLVHHPYDAFGTSVQRFIEAAAQDPKVLAIKQTFYRTSADSPMMAALIRAAEEGKQVAVSVEIKARFDEANNIEWSEALESAGAHVGYGHVGLKNHAKVALVVREEAGGLRCYTHLGTGNYNPQTAKLYTDLGLLTCDPEIAADVVKLFNLLTGYLHRPDFKRLLVAPINMKSRFLELIRRETEHQQAGPRRPHHRQDERPRGSRRSSPRSTRRPTAGVEIDLIVRGICRLRPGLPGRSETVRVISIVGRFLEHARIFRFGNGGRPEHYFGSADWMSRNLNYRVEAVAPIREPALQAELDAMLELQLADNVKAWELRPDGSYVQRRPADGEAARSSQELLMERALAGAARARAEG